MTTVVVDVAKAIYNLSPNLVTVDGKVKTIPFEEVTSLDHLESLQRKAEWVINHLDQSGYDLVKR